MGLETELEQSQSSGEELLLETPGDVGRKISRRRGVGLVVGLVVLCGFVALWHNPTLLSKVNSGGVVGLSENTPEQSKQCHDDMPYVMIEKVVSSNLGKQGPDNDEEEGIIYDVKTHNLGEHLQGKKLQIHIHSLKKLGQPIDLQSVKEDKEAEYADDYEPAFKKGNFVNGIHGKFACINIKQGTSLALRAHVYDVEAKEDIELPHALVSFFDIDTGKDGTHSVESVKVGDYSAFYLSNETQIEHTTEGNYVTFTATKEGTGDDNPKAPMVLTKEQKNKAVTVEFENIKHFDFEVAATEGKTARVFSFVFRPSMICATTDYKKHLYPASGKGAPIQPEKTSRSGAQSVTASLMLMLGIISMLFA